jgi:hypothetical protein
MKPIWPTGRTLAGVALLASLLFFASSCNFSKGTSSGALTRLKAAIAAGDDKTAIGVCKDYLESESAKRADPSSLSRVQDDCAAAFYRWFVALPDRLDEATLQEISSMTWLQTLSRVGEQK